MPAFNASQGNDTRVIRARKFMRTTAMMKMMVMATGTERSSAATMVVFCLMIFMMCSPWFSFL